MPAQEIKITKEQLRRLQECRGHLNTDSGRVFDGVVGRLHDDGLYHLTVHHSFLSGHPENERVPEFSLSRILAEFDVDGGGTETEDNKSEE